MVIPGALAVVDDDGEEDEEAAGKRGSVVDAVCFATEAPLAAHAQLDANGAASGIAVAALSVLLVDICGGSTSVLADLPLAGLGARFLTKRGFDSSVSTSK